MSNGKEYSQGFVEDPRYRQCNREALMGLGLGIVNLIWWFAWGYGLGSKPPEEYTYIYGLPMWFFMSCIVGAVLFSIAAIIMVTRYFEDTPLGQLDAPEQEGVEHYGGR